MQDKAENEDTKEQKLREKLRLMTYRMRRYRWEVFCLKYLKGILKVAVTLLISILAELGVQYVNRE